MNDLVWISTAPHHPSHLRPLRHDLGERDEARLPEITKKIKTGERLEDDEFPTQIWVRKDSERDYDHLHPIFYAYGYWIVSGEVVSILRQFDLGRSRLEPVEVLRRDRQTHIGDEWFCINIASTKRALIAEQSPKTKDGWDEGRLPPFVTKDYDITVSQEALAGPDIWIDPLLHRSFFLSGPLGSAIKKAKLFHGFFLRKCTVAP